MRTMWNCRRGAVLAAAIILAAGGGFDLHAQAGGRPETTSRGSDEGDGPYDRLILRGVTVIDGTGAPPQGPVDIVIEDDRIAAVQTVGFPGLDINENRRPDLEVEDNPAASVKEIDLTGHYIMPGFVDMHAHTGGMPKAPQPEYVYKLWMGHGITTSRGVGHGPMMWSLGEKARAARNEIVAPRMYTYARPGEAWEQGGVNTPERAREWVRWAAAQEVEGQKIDGLKLGSYDPPIMEALIDEARRHGLGTVAHLGQMGVGRMTALDAAEIGLDMMTHYYGLFESMLSDYSVQDWPLDYNYQNEQHRFGNVARLWDQVDGPGSESWNALLERFLDLGFGIDPTMTIYEASRDVMAARNADWHEDYTLPSQWDFYQPSRAAHGSYWFYWGTEDEVAWRNFYKVWMQFLNEYKNRGGRVTTGSDSGFIYKLYGFDYIREFELLREAGFHPVEVIRSATLHGAQELSDPKGVAPDFGMIRAGLKADFVVVEENPLQNLKVLYGTGAVKLNDETGETERVGGIKYTIKDGIVYDAKQLLADVREMVRAAKAELATQDEG